MDNDTPKFVKLELLKANVEIPSLLDDLQKQHGLVWQGYYKNRKWDLEDLQNLRVGLLHARIPSSRAGTRAAVRYIVARIDAHILGHKLTAAHKLTHPQQRGIGKNHAKYINMFELLARVIPCKARLEAFEPAYDDVKREYLQDWRQFRGKIARTWLAVWFGLHVLMLIGQTGWSMCSERMKLAILGILSKLGF